jgi:PQQ enzyme repeat
VISIALDGRMFAINKATGEVVWERKIADPANAEVLTIAPLVIRDMAIVALAFTTHGIMRCPQPGHVMACPISCARSRWCQRE